MGRLTGVLFLFVAAPLLWVMLVVIAMRGVV